MGAVAEGWTWSSYLSAGCCIRRPPTRLALTLPNRQRGRLPSLGITKTLPADGIPIPLPRVVSSRLSLLLHALARLLLSRIFAYHILTVPPMDGLTATLPEATAPEKRLEATPSLVAEP